MSTSLKAVIVDHCPACDTSPAYRMRLDDPWDTHEVCPVCAYCYTHGNAAIEATTDGAGR